MRRPRAGSAGCPGAGAARPRAARGPAGGRARRRAARVCPRRGGGALPEPRRFEAAAVLRERRRSDVPRADQQRGGRVSRGERAPAQGRGGHPPEDRARARGVAALGGHPGGPGGRLLRGARLRPGGQGLPGAVGRGSRAARLHRLPHGPGSGDVLANRVKAGWKVLLTDACHSGKINAETTNEGLEAQWSALPASFLTLTATTEREQSFEDPQLATGFGFFTYYLVQAFRGYADADPCDGRITADELIEYVRSNVRRYARDRQLSQTPTARGDYEPDMLLGARPGLRGQPRPGPVDAGDRSRRVEHGRRPSLHRRRADRPAVPGAAPRGAQPAERAPRVPRREGGLRARAART